MPVTSNDARVICLLRPGQSIAILSSSPLPRIGLAVGLREAAAEVAICVFSL
jgi:hypothetical protein